jgi:hypothetical protein
MLESDSVSRAEYNLFEVVVAEMHALNFTTHYGYPEKFCPTNGIRIFNFSDLAFPKINLDNYMT